MATAEPQIENKVFLTVPWNVIVHNDPVNLTNYVAKVFMKVFGFDKKTAEKHMMEVHELGKSVVWTGDKEKAEMYVAQLHGYLLTATIEKTE